MLINKIKKYFSTTNNETPHVSSKMQEKNTNKQTSEEDIRSRENEVFGKEKLQQQRLYEKWVSKNSWLLKSEGIPLLLGMDPQAVNDKTEPVDNKHEHNDLWEHAKRCVEQNLLPVSNKENSPETWEVSPVDLYCWASVSRILIPDQLVRLVEFVIHTIKQPVAEIKSLEGKNNHNSGGNRVNPETFQKQREQVLGAALAILARYPEKCKNRKGKTRSEMIVNLINEKGDIWFGDDKLLLSTAAMQDLLDKFLKTID
jgi:hypothetical protein